MNIKTQASTQFGRISPKKSMTVTEKPILGRSLWIMSVPSLGMARVGIWQPSSGILPIFTDGVFHAPLSVTLGGMENVPFQIQKYSEKGCKSKKTREFAYYFGTGNGDSAEKCSRFTKMFHFYERGFIHGHKHTRK